MLQAFQSKKGLVTSGVVDPRTFAYLGQILPEK